MSEEVIEHRPPEGHRVRFADPQTEGELAVSFNASDAGTTIRQELDYRLRRRGAFAAVADLLFVRSQMRLSLQRSLAGFIAEVEERAGL